MWEIGHQHAVASQRLKAMAALAGPKILKLDRYHAVCRENYPPIVTLNSLFCKDKPSMAEISLSKRSDFS
jgi:hypothetical protein